MHNRHLLSYRKRVHKDLKILELLKSRMNRSYLPLYLANQKRERFYKLPFLLRKKNQFLLVSPRNIR